MGARASVLARVSGLAFAVAGCSSPPTMSPAKPSPPVSSSAEPARYAARLDAAGELTIEIDAHDARFASLTIESGAEPFVRELVAGPIGGTLAPVDTSNWPLSVDACRKPCTVRYRFALGEVAKRFGNPQYAAWKGESILAPPTTWLTTPVRTGQAPFELRVAVPEGQRFDCGLRRDASGAFVATLDDLTQAPYAVFGPHEQKPIAVGEQTVELVRLGPEPDIGDAAVEHWVESSAKAVAGYFGRFAPDRALVIVIVGGGRSIGQGTALGNGGASVIVHIGAAVSADALANDWVLPHEMVHLSMPGLSSKHRWMEEGLATYVEPIARHRAGRLATEEVWREWYHGMWQGQPEPGDGGFDGTDSWGRIYWGGAVFWLLADVAIHEQTGGKSSLRECLSEVVRQHGTIEQRWSVTQFLETCDRVVGKPVTMELYELHANKAVTFDLYALFARLGVKKVRRGVELDDEAPAAAVRRAITPKN